MVDDSPTHRSGNDSTPRITATNVAERAGVGVGTVSRTLNGSGPVAEATRRRVLEAAEALGYRPNFAARSTRTGRMGSIGLLMSAEPDERSPVFRGMLSEIRQVLRDRDLSLTIGDLPDLKPLAASKVPAMLREWRVDGMLVNLVADLPAELVELIDNQPVPRIWMNTRRPSDAIRPDDHDAAYRATVTLLEAGHRRIAFLSEFRGRNHHYSLPDREAGYASAMSEAGLAPVTDSPDHFQHMRERQDRYRALLAGPDRPTALLGYEKVNIVPAYCAALSLGFQVPRDLSLVGIHDRIISDVGVRISTMRIPAEEMGRLAVQRLLEREPESRETSPSTVLPFEWVGGDTVGPPRDPRPDR